MTNYAAFSEQDTVDTLILPYLSSQLSFPGPDSLDYQAQHHLVLAEGLKGRYDGLYLAGGYPYVVLEAKRYSHDLDKQDFEQARNYATSNDFDKPVPILVLSNGREYQFFKRTDVIDPVDKKVTYVPIPHTNWTSIKSEEPGEVRQLVSELQLLETLRRFKQSTQADVSSLFNDPLTNTLDTKRHALGVHLDKIIERRRNFAGDTTTASDPIKKRQQAIRQAIDAVALHFTIKILFIKLIEDLSHGTSSQRIIHSLFPKPEYDEIGGLFGYKILNSLSLRDSKSALKIYAKSKKYYKGLARSLAKVTWQDIFRYGFSVHTAQYGQLFKANDYDKFLPDENTLSEIQERLIQIDIRTAIIYGSSAKRTNVIGDIYERLIDEELRSGLGAVYTPDDSMKFMVDLASAHMGGFRAKKIVEPACGSGHFYREIYRRYVDTVVADAKAAHSEPDLKNAHMEALEHVYGRDIDPFAVQLTLLSTFLEQLKDNIGPDQESRQRVWLAEHSVDTQNSLDPITIDPTAYFDLGEKTDDLHATQNRIASCKRSMKPDLLIGNPPYGVSVVKGDHYDDVYDLQSPDSYGYFIVNAIRRLNNGGRVIFIVSSSFLTIGTHRKLRKFILDNSKVIRVVKLHRATFPGIDVFPVIIELERCDDPNARKQNIYQFYDLWRLHPVRDKIELVGVYTAILNDLDASKPWTYDETRLKRYVVRQGSIDGFSGMPIFEGRPSLYKFMADALAATPAETLQRNDGSSIQYRPSLIRGRKLAKLKDIADAKVGLQSGANSRFYRVSPGVKGGAAKGGYKDVPLHQVVSAERIAAMSDAERSDGFQVDDPANDRFFVPLDKAGASDIEGGLLPLFYRPVEFYVNWSQSSVSEMKAHKSAVFRNSQHYFRRGISFSNTGIYCPTYRLGHGGVFDQTGSNVFCDVIDQKVLLGILSSTLLKYFEKSFINHGTHAQLEELPIAIPSAEDQEAIKTIVNEIISQQIENAAYDYREKLAQLDAVVNDVYGLDTDEKLELTTWYRRHYPKLTGDGDEEA